MAESLHALLAEGFDIAQRTLPKQQPHSKGRHKHMSNRRPRSVREDVSTLVNRAKALRKLAKLEARDPQPRTSDSTSDVETDTETRNYLRDILSDPPDLRTALETPLHNADALILDPPKQLEGDLINDPERKDTI